MLKLLTLPLLTSAALAGEASFTFTLDKNDYPNTTAESLQKFIQEKEISSGLAIQWAMQVDMTKEERETILKNAKNWLTVSASKKEHTFTLKADTPDRAPTNAFCATAANILLQELNAKVMREAKEERDEAYKRYRQSRAKKIAKEKELEKLNAKWKGDLNKLKGQLEKLDEERNNGGDEVDELKRKIEKAIREMPEEKKREAERTLEEIHKAAALYKHLTGVDGNVQAELPKPKDLIPQIRRDLTEEQLDEELKKLSKQAQEAKLNREATLKKLEAALKTKLPENVKKPQGNFEGSVSNIDPQKISKREQLLEIEKLRRALKEMDTPLPFPTKPLTKEQEKEVQELIRRLKKHLKTDEKN